MSERDRRNYAKMKADPVKYAAYLERKRAESKGRLGYEAKRKKKWRESNPVVNRAERRAHHAVENAIRQGKLVRPHKCERCGETGNIEAHHPDYTKPLDVAWLCRNCHSAEHFREALC